jgi:hypothetical protein
MRKLLMVAAMAAVLVPTASNAQFTLGARLGYAPAGGNVGGDVAMEDLTVKSQIPIQLDAMYRVSPQVAVGAYFSYGVGQVDYPLCSVSGVECSGSDLRLGLQATYTFVTPGSQFAPWLGAGIGWEQASDTIEAGGTKSETSYSGIEFLNLQLGGDFQVNEKFAVGPYAMISFGSYSSAEEDGVSYDITNSSMHEWYGFGIRGKFDL